MYAVYRQAHTPTAVEFSVYCNFISSKEKNLVVAGTSQLCIYRIIHDVESSSKSDKSSDSKMRREKLEQVASFSLFGNVMSMASVQLVGSSRDALLLSFKDAKLSVVEYDPGTHDLKTLSLHFFEEPELRDGFVQNNHIPIVRVDPENRCAVMLVYGTKLVVLPFRRDTLTDEQEGGVGEGPKSSFLPSYIIDVRELDEKLLNIIDMKFLHGYYEPTLLILFEPNQTWPGRVAVRQDTCSIVAISLNIMQKVHPVIWSLSNLPFDCMQVMAVPKPIGGVVVFAVNSLLYLNQSVPPYGVSLNSQTNGTTAFPLRVQEEVKITLDCAQSDFIDYDKMVISLKGGEIYVLTLITDGLRSVRAFHFDKAAASVLTTCMVTMEPGYLFLGSRLGNSLLLKYIEKLQELMAVHEFQEEPPSKKKKIESSTNWTDEVDEIEVYGSEAQSGTQLATYSFEVCDSILNIGPCNNASMGEPAFLSEEFQSSSDPDLEVVVCSGYGKNGALSVLQRSIRPQVVTTFELPGCHDMWTVIANEVKEEKKAERPMEDDAQKHGFLILSREDSTMVNNTYFTLDRPTVRQLHFIPVDLGSPIVHCSVADPYVVIMTAEGVVTMFVLKTDSYMGKTHRLSLQKPQISTQSRVVALCAYRDISGIFTTENKVNSSLREDTTIRGQSEAETIIQDLSNVVDDEEEMLYGDLSSNQAPPNEENYHCATAPSGSEGSTTKTEPTSWCMVVRENGVMEVRVTMLVDSSSGQSATQGEGKKEERQGEIPLVKEVALVSLGNNHSRPYLLVHVEQELLIYEAFPYDQQQPQNNLKVRFKKVPHNINFREKKTKPKKDKKAESEDNSVARGRIARFRYFEDISGYSGVFICGPSPHWLLVTSRGAMRLHPMSIDGSIDSFSPFHNVNCPKGFLYFNKQGYVAAGTCLMHGEEVTCRGRILILDVIEVVPEPGQPLTKNKFKVLYEKEQKGPVTALCHCSGYLVSAIGQKIFLWVLKDNDLTGMAFIDTQLYIHQMFSIKNFILAADLMKSVSLLRYQEGSKTLSLVSRDAKPLEVYSIEFMVDNNQLGLLGNDCPHVLLLYKSFGGMRLLRRADFNVGANVNTFWRMPCRGVQDAGSKKAQNWDNKHITWFATLDGGIGLLLPMQEKTYRRLLMLQNALNFMLPHHAGLNPKAFRMLHSDRRCLQNAVRNILDGELLNKYLYLSMMERSELAKKIGTTQDIILDDLLDIDKVTANF
uniref:Cleavage and polyadenylation specificity factor subunit 1 n=1 Tax=Gouania willdenowi TaxID=441366 RepID=A0A8C5DIP8_GOUWI